MPREDAIEKAARLAASGRICIRLVVEDRIEARVRGDSAIEHAETWDPEGWRCSCPAGAVTYRACSHVRAVQLCVLVEPSRRPQDRGALIA